MSQLQNWVLVLILGTYFHLITEFTLHLCVSKFLCSQHAVPRTTTNEVSPSLGVMKIVRHQEANQKMYHHSLLGTMLGPPIPAVLQVLDLRGRLFKCLNHSSHGSLSSGGFPRDTG